MAFKYHQQLLKDMKIPVVAMSQMLWLFVSLNVEENALFFSETMSLFLFNFISHLNYQISFSNLKVGTPRPGCALLHGQSLV